MDKDEALKVLTEALEREKLAHEIATSMLDGAADMTRAKVLAEREACARVCEQAGIDGYGTLAAAALIRRRGLNV